MTPPAASNPYHNPETTAEGVMLVEFVDVWKPLTPEDLARPRYGRPKRLPPIPPMEDGQSKPPADDKSEPDAA